MTKENLTSLNVILDRSGSMAGIIDETIEGFNSFVKDQSALDGEAYLTLAVFDDQYELIHDNIKLSDVPKLTSKEYSARGWTALLDAVGKTINATGAKLDALPEEEKPSKVLFLIMTDGAENYSKEFHANQIKEMIEHQKEKYSWEFVFIGANIDTIAAGASIGVAAANSYAYTPTSAGTHRLFKGLSSATANYRSSPVRSSYVMVDPTKENDSDTKSVDPVK